jgi:hypothetical protein
MGILAGARETKTLQDRAWDPAIPDSDRGQFEHKVGFAKTLDPSRLFRSRLLGDYSRQTPMAQANCMPPDSWQSDRGPETGFEEVRRIGIE